MTINFTDLHCHTEYSLKDGMIRVADIDDPKHIKSDIILNAERRGTGAITSTDHGNMYAHASMASVAKTFGMKHIPGCEFYYAPASRYDKNTPKGGTIYHHICAWAKDKAGYRNMCILQRLSYEQGFYYKPRIDKELVDKYGDGIMWSDACITGILSSLILSNRAEDAYAEFMWYLNRFKDDFYIEYQNHGIPAEIASNDIKVQWAVKHGVPIIATTDAHYYKKDDGQAHLTLLAIQYANWVDNPTFEGFDGDGYWMMDEDELLQRYPVEYLNNTQLIVDKVQEKIIEFGNVTPPKFKVPQWFVDKFVLEGAR